QDVAHCFVEALFKQETIGQVYPLGGPRAYSWVELYNACRALMPQARHWKPLVSQPVWAAKAAAAMSGPPMAIIEALPGLKGLGLFRFDRGQVDGLCFFACVNPWTQFPGFFIVGLLIGTPAAVLTGALAYATRTARTIPLPIALPSLFLALPLAVPIFDVSGIVVALLAVPIASAILVVAAVPELRRRAA
ncbi:MAG: hypothetical protein AABY30_00810, partial [Candidatus Thermoplasmatota archaeon]